MFANTLLSGNFELIHRNGSSGNLRRWLVRRRLDILASQVPAFTTDVPCLIDETVLPADIFSVALASGGDIRFTTDPTGNTLANLEIEEWDPVGGTAKFWVRSPTISAISNTPLYLFYGRSGVSQPAPSAAGGSEGVWSSVYLGRYSMADFTTSQILDSTSNGNTGNKFGANQPIEAAGKIDLGQDFDSANDSINIGTFDPGTSFTVEGWINWDGDDGSSYQTLYAKRDLFPAADMRFQVYRLDDAGQNQMAYFTGTGASPILVTFPTDIPSVGTWERFVVTHTDGAAPVLWFGETSFTASGASNLGTDLTSANRIGGNDTTNESFNGRMDEVRISTGIRTNQHIIWTYRNMNNVSNTISLNPLTF